ncbi:DUF1272 domain-containing protein [Aliikangiella sp. G2MR2-5]|uniref:DUF1272 domain-containing protein n=1 Tax=Aliikangiella sp. G2MR2-5 TaxID=2788943 RepID=UPI0018A9FD72|nr:DUF1272 domain-containing protein [Aliikangiella sp. G2MR2-5]
MLEIRPNCECCDKDLQAHSTEAMICSYECTFCKSCVDNILENVCPNCGGGFVARPIRPENDYREGVSLKYQKASTKRVHTPYSEKELRDFSRPLKHIKPEAR